ncbi:hypothetical protein ECE50_026840 [Chitinophaga sp. Mgbs1]|uniref:Uncharacterized protein n=1 Tax=Chitinophaga solisilvae TaxID=1233460 RepID=A0A9Q5GUZ6_9BACT|nr:hypothetical protein [Chitinophaga solisilvae]
MTREDFKVLMQVTEKIKNSPRTPEESIQIFRKLGILDAQGKLTPEFEELRIPRLNI